MCCLDVSPDLIKRRCSPLHVIIVSGIILLHKLARFKETAQYSKHEKIPSKNKACHDILLLLLLLIIIIVVVITFNYANILKGHPKMYIFN